MTKTPQILAIDAGTSALKAVLYDSAGRLIASVRRGYEYNRPQAGWAEANPDDWWEALVAAVQELKLAFELQSVKAIALTGQMHTAVLLDEHNHVIPPTIMWLDRRATAETSELIETNKVPPFRLNSTYTLPKLLWLSRNRPDTVARTRKLLWPKDYLRFLLTGQAYTDMTEAAGAALLDWDQGDWAASRLAGTGLDPAVLPPIRPATADAGPLLPSVAIQLGLSIETKVIIGAGDIIALLAAAPPQKDRLTCCLGSSAMIAVPLDAGQTFHDPQNRLYYNVVPPFALINAVLNTGGAALTWAWRALYGSQIELDQVLKQVQNIAPAAQGLLFLPFLTGERSPYWNDNMRGGFYGLTLDHKRAHMVRAVMEGIAFNIRHVIDICAELGVPVREIALSGGGADVEGWPQIIADICGRTVNIYVTQETVTRPLYAYCAHALDRSVTVTDALQTTFVEEPQIITPRLALSAVYERTYQSFRIIADFVANSTLPAYTIEMSNNEESGLEKG